MNNPEIQERLSQVSDSEYYSSDDDAWCPSVHAPERKRDPKRNGHQEVDQEDSDVDMDDESDDSEIRASHGSRGAKRKASASPPAGKKAPLLPLPSWLVKKGGALRVLRPSGPSTW